MYTVCCAVYIMLVHMFVHMLVYTTLVLLYFIFTPNYIIYCFTPLWYFLGNICSNSAGFYKLIRCPLCTFWNWQDCYLSHTRLDGEPSFCCLNWCLCEFRIYSTLTLLSNLSRSYFRFYLGSNYFAANDNDLNRFFHLFHKSIFYVLFSRLFIHYRMTTNLNVDVLVLVYLMVYDFKFHLPSGRHYGRYYLQNVFNIYSSQVYQLAISRW